MVLNVLGEELRWADGVNCETSNGILQPKVGHVGFGGGYVKKVGGGTSFIEFLGWFFRCLVFLLLMEMKLRGH